MQEEITIQDSHKICHINQECHNYCPTILAIKQKLTLIL